MDRWALTHLIGPELADIESSGPRPQKGPSALTHQSTISILTIPHHIS